MCTDAEVFRPVVSPDSVSMINFTSFKPLTADFRESLRDEPRYFILFAISIYTIIPITYYMSFANDKPTIYFFLNIALTVGIITL